VPVARNVLLQVNSDEEIGSPSSRALTEEAARKSAAVLVLEPGAGLDGKLKTARKGVGDYTITVRGRAAHAGLDFSNGASAILEMSRQIEKIAGFTRLDRGITVSPGVIQGGTRSNVIPAECRAEIDVRIPRASGRAYLERRVGRFFGGIVIRRGLRREFYGSAGRADARWPGRRGGGRARGQ